MHVHGYMATWAPGYGCYARSDQVEPQPNPNPQTKPKPKPKPNRYPVGMGHRHEQPKETAPPNCVADHNRLVRTVVYCPNYC